MLIFVVLNLGGVLGCDMTSQYKLEQLEDIEITLDDDWDGR